MLFFKKRSAKSKSSEVEVRDPVEEFGRELGLTEYGRQRGGRLARIISAAHRWTLSESAAAAAVAVFAAVVFAAAAAAAVAVFAAAVVAVAVAITVTSKVSPDGGKANRASYYTFLAGLGVIAIVGSVLGHPVASSIPFTVDLVIWIFNGIRLADGPPSHDAASKSAEDLVAGAFERFMNRYRPDLQNGDSSLNQKLALLAAKISEARAVEAKLRGELKVATGWRRNTIEGELAALGETIRCFSEERDSHEKAKNDMLAALQVFEGLKSEAVSHVRCRLLIERSQRVRGEVLTLSREAVAELEDIRARIVHGLIRLNDAAERLGLAVLPELQGRSLKALYAAAEKVGESAVRGQAAVNDLL